jgi:hypothetical protein
MGAERPKFIRAEGGRCVLVIIGVTRGGIKTRGGDHLMSGAYPHFNPYMSLRMLYRVPVIDDALHGFDHILEALGFRIVRPERCFGLPDERSTRAVPIAARKHAVRAVI